MLFRTQPSQSLAISQPTHAWISGQLLRAWGRALPEPLLLAAEQHDIGWLDWETAPSFDPLTGLPHLFRDVGASIHAPMWQNGVVRALGAWGPHVALLISRHGGVIYRRFTDRHRLGEADAAAARHYLEIQAPIEADWAATLGLDASILKTQSALVALVDTLSLVLCGELKAPLDLEAPAANGDMETLHLSERPGRPFEFVLSPWPFGSDAIEVEGPARPLPAEGPLCRRGGDAGLAGRVAAQFVHRSAAVAGEFVSWRGLDDAARFRQIRRIAPERRAGAAASATTRSQSPAACDEVA